MNDNGIRFYKNWWDVACVQEDEHRKLVFLETIFAYAFSGAAPDQSAMEKSDYAIAACAFFMVKPIIDAAEVRAVQARENGLLGRENQVRTLASKRVRQATGKQRASNRQATGKQQASNEQATDKQQASNGQATDKQQASNGQATGKPDEATPLQNKNMNMNRKEELQEESSSSSHSLEVVLAWASSTIAAPEDFVRKLYAQLDGFGWTDANGEPIRDWRRFFAHEWRKVQYAAPAAAVTPVTEPARCVPTEADL